VPPPENALDNNWGVKEKEVELMPVHQRGIRGDAQERRDQAPSGALRRALYPPIAKISANRRGAQRAEENQKSEEKHVEVKRAGMVPSNHRYPVLPSNVCS